MDELTCETCAYCSRRGEPTKGISTHWFELCIYPVCTSPDTGSIQINLGDPACDAYEAANAYIHSRATDDTRETEEPMTQTESEHQEPQVYCDSCWWCDAICGDSRFGVVMYCHYHEEPRVNYHTCDDYENADAVEFPDTAEFGIPAIDTTTK